MAMSLGSLNCVPLSRKVRMGRVSGTTVLPKGRTAKLAARANAESGESVDLAETPVGKMMSTQFRQGYRIKWGVLTEKVEDNPPEPVAQGKMSFTEYLDSTDDERAALRAKAAQELQNIDGDERNRRYRAGAGLAVFTLALGLGLEISGVEGAARWPMFFPIYFSLGFLGSGYTGL